jgi:tripartite-type tricarboxylate transporter receptor subunit TctC
MTILTRFLSSLALAVALATPQAVSAQTYPTKPIQVVVPAGPGSATDTVTRLILKKMEEQGSFSRPFVVVNTVGPLAATRVKDAAADGHELLVYHLGLPGLRAVGRLPFGVEAFEVLAQTGSTRFLVVARAEGPYKDLRSLVAAAKARPGEITEANSIGGAVHIAALSLAEEAGFKARIVNVGDGPKRLASVLGGHTAYTLVSPQEYLGFQGKGVKALAVVGAERSRIWTDVPTTRELGLATDISVDVWWFAPKGTPAAIVNRLSDAIGKAMADPGLKDALDKQGVDAVHLDAAGAKARVQQIDRIVQPMGPALGG